MKKIIPIAAIFILILSVLSIAVEDDFIKCPKVSDDDDTIVTINSLATIPGVTTKPISSKKEISRDEENHIITYYSSRFSYIDDHLVWHIGDNDIDILGCDWNTFEDLEVKLMSLEKDTRDDNTFYWLTIYVRGDYLSRLGEQDLERKEYDPRSGEEFDVAVESLGIGTLENPQEEIGRQIAEETGSCFGCLVNEVCYEHGSRFEPGIVDDKPRYCSSLSDTMLQEPDGSVCSENFECLSNSCIDGTCSGERGFFLTFFNWIRNFFG